MLCISHIDYANAMLFGTTKKVLNKYQTLQNMCAKLVLENLSMTLHHKHYNSYTGYWYREGFITKILMLIHKCIYG